MTGVADSKTNTTCVVDPDPNSQILSLQMCGNGIVETNEDCDPGKGVNSTCCDSTTCKFKSDAVCDPQSSPCCTTQCSYAPVTQVCRPSRDSKCDTAEMCTGNSSSCPTDVTSPNGNLKTLSNQPILISDYTGQVCGSNDLKCASGQCTSVACMLLMLDFFLLKFNRVAVQCQTVGASMGLEDACSNRGDTSCQVSCQDPTQTNQCVSLSTILIDGSPCGIPHILHYSLVTSHCFTLYRLRGCLLFGKMSIVRLPGYSKGISLLAHPLSVLTHHRRGTPKIFRSPYPLRLLLALLPFSFYGP